MKQLPKILNDIDHRDGMTVPEGYFADFASKMAQALPEKNLAPENRKRSTWMKIRPYAYMAAMFAGIWLMMQMFIRPSLSLHRKAMPPQVRLIRSASSRRSPGVQSGCRCNT